MLAYSGGLGTSVAIPWLADTYSAEIITVTVDLGQGRDLEEVRDRALANGALRAHVLDVRYEFARDCIVRALKAGVLCEDGRPQAAPLGRPLVAQTLVTIARIEQTTTVAHGDRRSDGSPIDAAVRSLDPALTVVAPAREWTMTAEQEAAYAQQHAVALPVVAEPNGSRPSQSEPAFVDIAFERGAPVAINGVTMHPLDLIGSLEIIAGARGTARVERVDPVALAALDTAHRELQQATITGAKALKSAAAVADEYRQIIRDGSWFGPRRAALDADVDRLQTPVTGIVRLKVFNGDSTVVECHPSATVKPKTIRLTTKH